MEKTASLTFLILEIFSSIFLIVEIILFWLGSCHEIGVDMEQIRKELPRFPEKMLSPTDFSFWKKQNDLDKIRCFFELWTRKESYTKLHGDSIFRKAKELSVSDGEQFREFMGTSASYFTPANGTTI